MESHLKQNLDFPFPGCVDRPDDVIRSETGFGKVEPAGRHRIRTVSNSIKHISLCGSGDRQGIRIRFYSCFDAVGLPRGQPYQNRIKTVSNRIKNLSLPGSDGRPKNSIRFDTV